MGNQNSLSHVYQHHGVTKASGLSQRSTAFQNDEQTRVLLQRQFGTGAVFGQGEISGGAEGVVLGGAGELQDYGNSLYSRAKETLIRNIAKEVFKALGAKGLKNPDSAPISSVVKDLAELIPPMTKKPKKFVSEFETHGKAQRSVCRTFANAINKHYGGMIIDLDLSDNEICNKVSEVMQSLFTGLHTEFMTVAGDVLRTFSNMQTVMDYIESAYKRQKELAEKTGDNGIKNEAQNTDEIYKTVKSEYNRQAAIMANLINVTVGPTGKSLISSLEDNGDFVGLVRNLKAQVGTKAFGDKLAHLLAGVSTVAHAAELVEKALKKIGMSVQDFKNSKNNYDLHMKVYNHILKGAPTSKRLDEMMAAAKIIYENTYDHDSIAKYLTKKGKGETYGGNDSDSDDEVAGGYGIMGGDDDDENDNLPNYWSKKSISKKISNKKKYRDLVLSDFRKLLKEHHRVIVEAANGIARHIGVDLPVSDDLDQFVKTFSVLPNLDQEKLHIALSGYAKDALSKEKREQFINSYDSVIKAVDPLTKGPQGSLFKQVQQALQSMIRSIDDFSDKMVKALTEIHVDDPDAIAKAIRSTATAFYGSAENDGDVFGTGSWVAFDKVKMEMKYFYSIANIKSNIARSNHDMKSYADDYEQILGEEAGYIINNIKKEYNDLLNLDYKGAAPANVSQNVTNMHIALNAIQGKNEIVDANGNAVAGGKVGGKNRAEWTFKNLTELWNYQMNAKVNMVNVAQAVDLYLKAFTDGVSRNPDSVSHITKILDQVEIVARWFNEKSGDNLASLFEVFPNSLADDGTPLFSTGDSKSHITQDGRETQFIPSNTHYYTWLEGKWSVDNVGAANYAAGKSAYDVATGHTGLPGNPFLGRDMNPLITNNAQLKTVFKLSEKVVKSMRALENILSCFASIGSKFGDLDPMSRTFMNAGQMFNALCQYMSASAFSHQYTPTLAGKGANTVTAAAYKSKISEEKILTQGKVRQLDDTRAVSEQTIPTNGDHAHYRPLTVVNQLRWSIDHAQLANDEINGGVAALNLPDGYGILTGVEGKHNGNNSEQHKYTKLAMSAIPAESLNINKWKYHNIGDSSNKIRLDVAGWQDNFYDTDLLFEMVIKSIVAKVFAIVDAYRLFHRPTVDRRASYSLNPLRMILGGNDSVEGGALLPNVKIIKEAVEFYFRIILLAEWYREQYGFNSNRQANADSWRLSIVPTVDGIWSDFIDVIFSKAEYVKEGNYSETQVQKLILAMNDIWKSYKSRFPKSTVSSIINAFVLEMNRIFGFMKQKEIDAYITDRRSFLENSGHGNYDENDKENFIDYDILNAKDQFGERLAPSAKFVNVNVKKNIANKQRNMVFLQEEIDKIKKKIDVDFINATRGEGDKNYSFQNTLKIYKSEVEHAKNDSDSYKVVLRMIQGANKYISLNSDKLIMVHEMVAAPLVCLYGVYKVLARYNAFLHGCSLKNIEKWSENRANAAAGGLAVQLDTVAAARVAYKAQLALLYPKVKTGSLIHELFARSFLGNEHGAYHNRTYDEGITVTQSGYMWTNVNNVLAAAGVAAAVDLAGNNLGIIDGKVNAVGLMRDLVAAVIDLAANQSKLVTCSVAANNINMDWSALEDLCISTLAQVKDNIKKLRNMFDPSTTDIVDKYEDRLLVGSTRWLEENLIEILFKDRDECGLQRGHTEHLRYTFDRLSKNNGNTATASGQLIHLPAARYGSVADSLRELIYYGLKGEKFVAYSRSCNFKDFPFNVIGTNRAATADEAKNLMDGKVAYINSLMPVPNLLFEQPIRCSDMHTLLVGRDDAIKSMFFAFNRILYSYLYTNFDDNSAKIYAPLIEGFANSAASYEILQGKAYCNATMLRIDYDTALPFNQHTLSYMENNNLFGKNYRITGKTPLSPDPASIIWLSNAVTIRSLLTTSVTLGTSQKKKFLFDNLADIPEFIKERMRVNLPLFSKLLSDFYDRANLLKSIISNTIISENIMHPAITAGSETDFENPVVVDISSRLALSGKDSGYMKEYLSTMLTKMAELGAALRKSADGVYREMQDKLPHFFETGKDFLLDYRNRFGGLPLMPVSSILAPLKCMDGKLGRLANASHHIGGGVVPDSFAVKSETDFGPTNIGYVLLPVKENGSNVYKFNYATRSILSQNIEPTMEHFPGAKEIYNAYASNTNKNVTLTPQEYADTIKKMVKLGKFLIDGAVYSRLYNQLDSMGLSVPKRVTTHDEYHTAAGGNGGLTGALVPAGKMRDLGAGYAVSPVVTDYATRGVFNALAWKDSNNLPGDLAEVLIKVRDKLGHAGSANVGQLAGSLFVNGAGDLEANIAHVALGLPMENIDSNLIGKTAGQISSNAVNTAIVRDLRSYLSDYLSIAKNEQLATATTAAEAAQFTELLHQSMERIYVDDPHTLPRSRADGARAEYLKNRLRRNMSILPLSDPLGLAGIIELTENTDIKVSKERLATALGTSISEFKDRKREDLRVFNILDMNIVPINVHAFMREVPFVNLLNYSYTFDRMVHDFILPNYISKKVDTGNASSLTTDNIIMAANDEVASTRELLVKLLVHPYAKLSDNGLEYFALAASLFNGNDNLKLGRPRYLSDQLWHKVLMTSSAQLVAGQEMYNNPGDSLDNRYGKIASLESGPQAYEAIRSVVANGMPFMNKTQRNENPVTFKNLENMLAAVLVACNARTALGTGAANNHVRNTLIPLMVLAQSDHKVIPVTPLLHTAGHAVGNGGVYADPPTPGVIALNGGAVARLTPNHLFAAGQSLAADNMGSYLPNLAAIVDAAKNNLLLSPARDKVAIKLIDQLSARVADNAFYQNTDAQDILLYNTLSDPVNFVTGKVDAILTNTRAGAVAQAALLALVTGGNALFANIGGVPLPLNLSTIVPNILAAGGVLANAGNLKTASINAFNIGDGGATDAAVNDLSAHALMGVGNTLDNLIGTLAAAINGKTQYAADTAGTYFNGKLHVANADYDNNQITYHFLSMLIDMIPYLTPFTKVILKVVARVSMHNGSTHVQLVNLLRAASVDQTTLQLSLFDRFMLECIIKAIDLNHAGAVETNLWLAISTAATIARSAAYVLINEIEHFNTTGRAALGNNLPSVLVLATNPVATPGLKIIKSNEYKENTWSAVNDNAGNNNNMAVGDVLYCAELGKMRFDTKLVRNLTWMVNLQRIMRVIMVNHLSHLNTPVIRGLKIANPKVTEFEANEKFEESDFNGEDYAAV